MKSAIWKFTVEVSGKTEIKAPKGSKVLDVKSQGKDLCVWVLVPNVRAEETIIKFQSVMTGEENSDLTHMDYVGTVMFDLPPTSRLPFFVVHVFVEPEA